MVRWVTATEAAMGTVSKYGTYRSTSIVVVGLARAPRPRPPQNEKIYTPPALWTQEVV